ncbi:MAG: hypothetical protein H7Z43_00400 [Clostridia bacterium]|nr:hypothetical protein [Deltaproteobacteria bacterium]
MKAANRWLNHDDPCLPQVLRELWARGQTTIKRPLTAGVYKHRTIQDAKALKEVWAKARRDL